MIREIQVQGKQVVKRKVYETDVEQDAIYLTDSCSPLL